MSRERKGFGALLPPIQPQTPEAPPKRQGKRGNPAYTQISAHIPRTLHRAVKRQLLDEERELGDLLEELLRAWTGQQERE